MGRGAALGILAAMAAGCAVDKGVALDLTFSSDCGNLAGVARVDITFETTPPVRLDSGGTFFSRGGDWIAGGSARLVMLLPEGTRVASLQARFVDAREQTVGIGTQSFTFNGPGRVVGMVPVHVDVCPVVAVDLGVDAFGDDLAVTDAGADLPVVPDLSSSDLSPSFGCGSRLFSGLNAQYIAAPHTAAYNPSGALTAEAWIFPAADATGTRRYIVGHGTDLAGGSPSWALWLNGSNNPTWCVSTDGGEYCAVATAVVGLDVWTHVAGVYQPATQTGTLYVNGVLSASIRAGNGTALHPVNVELRIGNSPGGNQPFAGVIDEVRVSSTARYSSTFVAPHPFEPDASTIALYHLDEPDPTSTVFDASSTMNPAAVGGSPQFLNGCVPIRCGSLLLQGGDLEASGASLMVGSFTVEAWVQPVTYQATDVNIVGRWGTLASATASYMLFLHNGVPTLAMTCDGKTFLSLAATYPVLSLNVWTHLAGTFDASAQQLAIYVNGIRVAQQSMRAIPCTMPFLPDGGGGAPAGTVPPFSVGYTDPTAGGGLQGYIDDVRLSSAVIYNGTFSPAETLTKTVDTVALYHFDFPSGSTTPDSSNFGNTATLHGGVVVDSTCH
jgi:hypothetical protein